MASARALWPLAASDCHITADVIGKRQVIGLCPRSPRSTGFSLMQTPVGSTTLRVLTTNSPSPEPPVCTGGYTCVCQDCAPALERRVRRGVRANRSNPIRRAA